MDQPLYTVVVPTVSVFHECPAKGTVWEYIRRDGVPDDLILKEGYPHSSYAASVEVKREFDRARDIEELSRYVSSELKRQGPLASQATQSNLLCVRPQVHVERTFHSPLFAMHSMHCLDPAKRHYYELTVSFMTKRRD